jgi:hypothetical protein
MTTRPLATLALLALLAAGGCAIDTEEVDDQSYASYGERSGRPWYSIDGQGNLLVDGHVLTLPTARENRRFGATFVDVTPLARPLRPLTAPDGGIVVAAIRSDSPLVRVGMRPFERIVAIDGQAVASLGSLVQTLESAPEGSQLKFTVRKHARYVGHHGEDIKQIPRGSDETLTRIVEVGGELDSGRQVWLPWVFEYVNHSDESEFTVGPFDVLFYTFNKHDLERDDTTDRFEWGALFNLIVYRSKSLVDPDGNVREPQRTVRLFYFFTI